jgi:hypothetical protein
MDDLIFKATGSLSVTHVGDVVTYTHVASPPTTLQVDFVRYSIAASSLRYIPMVKGGADSATRNTYGVQLRAPTDGRLLGVFLETDNAGGSGQTTVSFYVGSSTPVASINIDINSINAGFYFDFDAGGDSTAFITGQELSISVNPTSNHGKMSVAITWELEKP